MDEFYEEPPKLNIKKVIIISVIFLLILILLIVWIAKKISTPKQNLIQNVQVTETSSIFSSNDKSVSVELSNTLGLKNYNSELDYLIELRSDNNLDIFISKKEIFPNKSLQDVVNADKLAFLEKFENYSNLSDAKELSVNGNQAYTYSFHYLDKNLNQAFYLQIVWIQIENSYYIFDIEFPLDDLSFNTNVVTDVLSNFQINSQLKQ